MTALEHWPDGPALERARASLEHVGWAHNHAHAPCIHCHHRLADGWIRVARGEYVCRRCAESPPVATPDLEALRASGISAAAVALGVNLDSMTDEQWASVLGWALEARRAGNTKEAASGQA